MIRGDLDLLPKPAIIPLGGLQGKKIGRAARCVLRCGAKSRGDGR
jgi:hypothetical protein